MASAQRVQDGLTVDAFVRSHRPRDSVERADSRRLVVRNREPLMAWHLSLQNHMVVLLMHPPICPIAAE